MYKVYMYDYGYEKHPIAVCETLRKAEGEIDKYKRRSMRPEYLSFYIVRVDDGDGTEIIIHVE